MQYQKVNDSWAQIVKYYRKNNVVWEEITESIFNEYITNTVALYGGHDIDTSHVLSIAGLSSFSGESCTFALIYDGIADVTSAGTWQMVTGSDYASISAGTLTILPSASGNVVTIGAGYSGLTATKNIEIAYKSGTSTETETIIETDESGNTTTEVITVVTNEDGSSETSSSAVTYDASGNTIGTSESTTIVNEDGSSSSNTITTQYDESGNTIGSSENNTITNTDGSYNSTTTNYDENGDATNGTNVTGDTIGNVDTQEVEYDDSGNSVVVGYQIDTSGSEGEGRSMSGDGVNTEFVPFADDNCGFVMHIRFDSRASDQPRPPVVEDTEDTGSNWLYNIMCAKSATKTANNGWPGFDIRWALSKSSGSGSIQFRYTQSGATNTNSRVMNGKNADGTGSGDTFDVIVTYDPELILPTSRTTFSVTSPNGCISPIGTNVNFITNNIDFTLGYATNMQGEPYRYSSVVIHEFSITKVCSAQIITPETPEITCDGEVVTITCDTNDAMIYYRLNEEGNYLLYTVPFAITADTTVQAYSELMGQTSDITLEECIYTGIPEEVDEPVITCDGEQVTITCETPSVDIHYRISGESSYNIYSTPITISADTIFEAYSQLNSTTSSVVSANCIYNPGLRAPIISYDGEGEITITCSTPGASIYYKLDDAQNYDLYTTAITITATTVVYAYSQLNGETSTTVSETCVYNVVHDYSQDYLTFTVLNSGTIIWKALGSGYARSIDYSIDGGPWSSITSTSAGVSIPVVTGNEVRFRGSNTTYAGSKNNYSGFEGGTATYDISGNIMSLIHGDNFANNSTMSGTYNFCSIFKKSNVVSAEHLILPAMTLTNYCYRAMFSYATNLVVAPALPATTLSRGCYYYMFERCSITEAPELPATTLVQECYFNMFNNCASLNYIKCLATSISAPSSTTNWVVSVAATGTFVKDAGMSSWTVGNNGIPTGWVSVDDGEEIVEDPEIYCDGEEVIILCETTGASIYYNLNQMRSYTLYTEPIELSANTMVEAYAEKNGIQSEVVSANCIYSPEIPFSASNRNITSWVYAGQPIETPYSINAIDGHSSKYNTGVFNFTTTVNLKRVQPTYLWFQHADQSADIYVDDVKVTTHWGGYNAFFTDITGFVHKGINNIKVALCNTTRSTLAPCKGDFNYNATLGYVKLYTSPVLPSMDYGYDGFHVTSDVAQSAATITVKTNIPTGATVTCSISDGVFNYGTSGNSTGQEMQFSTTITNPHLWNGTVDPHLYNITLEIYHEGDLYHKYERPYGLRFFDYALSGTTMSGATGITYNGSPYTGFLLNGSPYFLRGVCMHNDIDGKANALTYTDMNNDFNIIQDLGCNFIRLAHYPHPKEIYDHCDELGIIVQTEMPWVGNANSTQPDDYYIHLSGQCIDMVMQHYNHPCIVFWGLSNETTTDDKAFAKDKIEGYTALIKSMDTERWVGYVMSHNYNNPSSYYNNPNVDWFGCNIYTGWYNDKNTNDPTGPLTTRYNNIVKNVHKPLAFSEYGAGGTQHCHSESAQTTTTTGNYERHDIEYQMWLHEGHIAAIRNFPQLLFTGEWQLFDIAVSNRNEGYTVCLDGVNTSTDDNLRRLNNKGLVERDHITKKDTYYIYKAEWNPEPFVHICGKDFTKRLDREIKCYGHDGNALTLYVDDTFVESASTTDNITVFQRRDYDAGKIIKVSGDTTYDTFSFLT